MKTESEIDEIKQKLFDKLEPNGWGRVFKSFIFSSEFTEILSKLYQLSIADKRFTPTLKQLFRAFEECPYDKLQIVIVGQDPYPTFGVADGIAFSCGNTKQLQPSLRFILDEVKPIAWIRELHVYGKLQQTTSLHRDTDASQHRGIGKKLIKIF